MNTPYVKEYNEEGICTNPIDGAYPTPMWNQTRKQRRAHKNKARFTGNNKGANLSVGPNFKYKRWIQLIFNTLTGKTKAIEHYTLVK